MRTWQKHSYGRVLGGPAVCQTKFYAKSSTTTRTSHPRITGRSARSAGLGVGQLLNILDSGRRWLSFQSLGNSKIPNNTGICSPPLMNRSSLSLHLLKRCVQSDELEMLW